MTKCLHCRLGTTWTINELISKKNPPNRGWNCAVDHVDHTRGSKHEEHQQQVEYSEAEASASVIPGFPRAQPARHFPESRENSLVKGYLQQRNDLCFLNG